MNDVTAEWPVLTRYDQDHLHRIALPLGGIGTGTVSLGGRGDLRDWEIVNRPAKGFAPRHAFFLLRTESEAGKTVTRALEGPIDVSLYEGPTGSTATNHGLPRFRRCEFEAAYPFGQVILSDPDVPLDVRLQAFNPLIPADEDASGIPIAVIRFQLANHTEHVVDAAVCGSLQNFIGSDGTNGQPTQNRNTFRSESRLTGLLLESDGVSPQAEQWGTIALCTTASDGITYRTAWARRSWGDSLLDFWDDFSADGTLQERAVDGEGAPVASLATRVSVPPGQTRVLTFLLTWYFPNRMTWTPRAESATAAPNEGDENPDCIGNYYTTGYADAWDVARRTVHDLPRLERDTLSFVHVFCGSDLPQVVKEAALFNLSTLRTQTCFRTEDGILYGWEGCCDRAGCCHGSCTHVWNYEQATPFIFGKLSASMRRVEFQHATHDNGLMSFRVNLPLSRAREWPVPAADGQMGCLMKLYRDWQLSGDGDLLRDLWPQARKALAFCWIPGGWDADRDGVMEGCQHNTMDVEYYGPNPQMGVWYLGALRAAVEMALFLGDYAFAETCRALFKQGSDWLDRHLFNGAYYEHQVIPPLDESAIAPGLRHESMGARDLRHPELQLGPGCLVDQLVGQYMAHVCGLGYLLDPDHVRTTLRSIMRENFRESLDGHFNHLRTFALQDESALLMCSYPRGNRPERPFPYFNEVMTGFEYTAAVHMLYEGQIAEGLRVIAAIRDRYDGRKRSPFDEAECGHHYARAMASWGAVLALTGFHYSAPEQTITFAVRTAPSCVFWSNGYAWGTCSQEPGPSAIEVTLTVLYGSLAVSRLELAGHGLAALGQARTLRTGESLVVSVPRRA